MVFISNYFIYKLIKYDKYYADDNFIYSSKFKQLLVILYYVKEKKKRFPMGSLL